MNSVSVIGGGAWGTALAQMLAAVGRLTRIWAREEKVITAINSHHCNDIYLPNVTLSTKVKATSNLAEAAETDVLLLVAPAQFFRSVAKELAKHLKPDLPVVICAKGIELGSHALMSEVITETLPKNPLAILSGPTFAIEVAQGMPTAVTLACADKNLGSELVELIGQPYFRPYWTDDVIGAQIGGAVKNVLAIACGIVEGRKLGDNARAALMTRGLAEMMRYGALRGARSETLMGLSGLGDLTLTCNSLLSRNMSLGTELGTGRTMKEVLAGRQSVAEGSLTAGAITDHIRALDIEMPICSAVDAILNQQANLDETIKALLQRPYRAEQG